LPVKVRTLESYLAGLGASGALIAGAFVAFVLLVGVVTFDAWPTGSGLFSRSANDVRVDTSLTTTPPARASVPNLVKLLGTRVTPTTAPGRAGGGQTPSGPPSGSRGPSGQRGPQDSNPGGGQQQPVQPTRPTETTQPGGGSGSAQTSSRNVLQETVSGVGTTLQGTTDSLSNTLGGEDSALGGLVGGVGSTVNNTLQGVAGN
jgi:hypothetical protein